MVKYMLSILMDEIKDTGMYIDYAIESTDMNSPQAPWFKNHAKMKLDEMKNDYDFISKEIGLLDKVRSGDEIAEALMCHITYQMKELHDRYNTI